jgi:periplasmic divalent cation tolerance protein
MTDKIIVLTTCAGEEDSHRLARSLVDTRLAACVNIVPRARSIYRWKGAVEEAEEWLLLIKSSRELYPELERRLAQAHSYETPEVIAIPIVDGSMPYLQWLAHNLGGVTEK